MLAHLSVKTAQTLAAVQNKPTADAANGQCLQLFPAQLLKFGQVVVVVRGTPAATAVRSL
jgi:hypothetical protein